MKRSALKTNTRTQSRFKKLKARAVGVFNSWIVLRDDGICYTCGRPGNQAGHFIHRKLPFSEVNTHCQCHICNCGRGGNLETYEARLIAEYGYEAVEKMKRDAEIVHRYSIDELETIIHEYGRSK